VDKLIIEMLTKAGPTVVVVVAFLVYLYRRDRASTERFAAKDEATNAALIRNAESQERLADSIRERPCMAEGLQKRFFERMERALEATFARVNGAPHD